MRRVVRPRGEVPIQGLAPALSIQELWRSTDAQQWSSAFDGYWALVKPQNLALERELNALELDSLRELRPTEWYEFLHEKYFSWKYTARNRRATTRARLRSYVQESALEDLDQIRRNLLTLDPENIATALKIATSIRGLGTAGGSGLLALMYPHAFATVDQFVVRALTQVPDPTITSQISRMNPERLTLKDGVALIRILRAKATENNRRLASADWTPRKIEMILWTYGAAVDPSRTRKPRGQQQRPETVTSRASVPASEDGGGCYESRRRSEPRPQHSERHQDH